MKFELLLQIVNKVLNLVQFYLIILIPGMPWGLGRWSFWPKFKMADFDYVRYRQKMNKFEYSFIHHLKGNWECILNSLFKILTCVIFVCPGKFQTLDTGVLTSQSNNYDSCLRKYLTTFRYASQGILLPATSVINGSRYSRVDQVKFV